MVLPKRLVALLAIGVLFVAASWVDAGRAALAASPDPHPSAEKSNAPAPAPDAYQPPTSQQPVSQPSAPEPVTEPVTQPAIQVDTTPSTGTVNRTPARPATDTRSGARTQKKPANKPDKATAPSTPRRKPVRVAGPTSSTPRHQAVRLAVATSADDGGPLLLGGIAMLLLALASGSMLLFVNRAGNAGVRRWETKT